MPDMEIPVTLRAPLLPSGTRGGQGSVTESAAAQPAGQPAPGQHPPSEISGTESIQIGGNENRHTVTVGKPFIKLSKNVKLQIILLLAPLVLLLPGIAGINDAYTKYISRKTDPTLPQWRCWNETEGGPAWGGSAAYALVAEGVDNDPFTPDNIGYNAVAACRDMFIPQLVWSYEVILPLAGLFVFGTSWMVVDLRGEQGTLNRMAMKLEENMNDVCGAIDTLSSLEMSSTEKADHKKLIDQSIADLEGANENWFFRRRYCYEVLWFILHAIVFCTEIGLHRYHLRKTLFFQVKWSCFGGTCIIVRPVVAYTSRLSHALIDCYAIELQVEKKKKNICSLLLIEKHRKLQHALADLWKYMTLPVLAIPVPFLVSALTHLYSRRESFFELWMALHNLVFAAALLLEPLMPLVKVDRRMNGTAVFREPREQREALGAEGERAATGAEAVIKSVGSMSIKPIAYSYLSTYESNINLGDEANAREYGFLVQYLEGSRVTISLGFGGFFRLPVRSTTVRNFYTGVCFHLPVLVKFLEMISESQSQRRGFLAKPPS